VRWAFVAIMVCVGSHADAGFVRQSKNICADIKSAFESQTDYVLEHSYNLRGGMTANPAPETSTNETENRSPTQMPPIGEENGGSPFGMAPVSGSSQSSSSPGGAGSSVSSVPLLSVMGMLPADQLVSWLAAGASSPLPPPLPNKLFFPPDLAR